MIENKFNEEDKKKFIEFLNFVAERATFKDWTTADSIKHFLLLNHMQTKILTKLDANILEIKEVINLKKEEKPASKSKKDDK